MTRSFCLALFVIVSILILYVILLTFSWKIALLSGVLILLFAAAHRKNQSKKNWDKHSGNRSGEIYGTEQNEKRGDKNKKYQKSENPNKRKKKDNKEEDTK